MYSTTQNTEHRKHNKEHRAHDLHPKPQNIEHYECTLQSTTQNTEYIDNKSSLKQVIQSRLAHHKEAKLDSVGFK